VVPGGEQPELFSSPMQHTRVDRVLIVPDAKIGVKVTPDGYVVEAILPLSALHWKPETGQALRGDFGVIYSDPAGQVDVLRMYWANQATGIVSDIGVKAQLQPNLWGVMRVE
jgi:hypothetical protein